MFYYLQFLTTIKQTKDSKLKKDCFELARTNINELVHPPTHTNLFS